MDLSIVGYFESSESSSDDDLAVEYILMRRPKIFRPRNGSLISTWDDTDFSQRYRLSKEIVLWIENEVGIDLKSSTTRNHAVTPLEQILLTLRFYATGTLQQCSGDLYGVSKSTACRIIHAVSRAISIKLKHFIAMPNTTEELKLVIGKFYAVAKFPSVIGAIDCTHIRILGPGGNNPELFRNRKDQFSINTQVVADSDLRIRNIVARWPGSVHDSTIFNNSKIKYSMESQQFGKCWLLGDRGYALKKYLLTPLTNPLTPAQKLYNESHIRTRNVVERTFGVWKRRFPCIGSQLRVKQENLQPIIVATAILHNICVERRVSLPNEITNENIIINDIQENNVISEDTQSDSQYRDQLVNTYFNSLINVNN